MALGLAVPQTLLTIADEVVDNRECSAARAGFIMPTSIAFNDLRHSDAVCEGRGHDEIWVMDLVLQCLVDMFSASR